MWARVVEVMLAGWLSISCFIFSYEPSLNDLICASLLALFSLLSFHPKLEKIHLCEYFVIVWLFYLTYSHGYPLPPILQNYQVLAFIFLMTAILPSHSHLSPKLWQEFLKKREKI